MPIKNITPVVYHFTALAKVQTNPSIAFNLSDCCHFLTQGLQTLVRGVGRGAINTLEHNIAFFASLATHPIDDIAKPFCQAGIALGKALYEATELAICDPITFGDNAKDAVVTFATYASEQPENAIAGVTELLLSFKGAQLIKLKPVRSMAGIIKEQKLLAAALDQASKITAKGATPLKEVFEQACATITRAVEATQQAAQKIIGAAQKEVELAVAGDAAMLKLPPT